MSGEEEDGTRWPVVLLLTATGALAGAHVYKLSPALPVLRDDLGLGLVAGGWLFSLVNLFALIMGLVAGTISDRIGHRRVIFGGLLVMGAASFAGSFAHDETALLLFRFLEGAGFLSVVIAAPSLIAREAIGRDRGLALGVWGSYLPAGAASVVLIAPFIMGLVGWRGLWQFTGLLSLVLLILLIRAKPRPASTPTQPRTSMATNVIRTVSSRGPWLPALSFGLYTVQFSALMSWLPTYMVEKRGIAPTAAGVLSALVIAVNIPGAIGGGILLRRGWGHGRLVAITCVGMAAMAAIIFTPTLPDGLRYAACAGLSLIGGMIPASVLGAAPLMTPSPAQIGTTNGLIVQGSNMGNVLGPPLMAAVITIRGRWEDALLMFVAAATLNLALSFFLGREETRRQDAARAPKAGGGGAAPL